MKDWKIRINVHQDEIWITLHNSQYGRKYDDQNIIVKKPTWLQRIRGVSFDDKVTQALVKQKIKCNKLNGKLEEVDEDTLNSYRKRQGNVALSDINETPLWYE